MLRRRCSIFKGREIKNPENTVGDYENKIVHDSYLCDFLIIKIAELESGVSMTNTHAARLNSYLAPTARVSIIR